MPRQMDSDPSSPRAAVDRTARRRWVDAAIFVIAIAVVAIPAWRALASNDMDPTTLLRVGKYSASREFIERDFADPVLTDDYGHDGQQFYVLAATFPDLEDAQGNIDRLRYRARRILLPALVSPVPRGAPLIWTIFVVNLAAVGSAAVAVGNLARRLGSTAWLGLVVAVTPAMIESVEGSLADALAFSLALWGVNVWRRRPWLAVALFTLAAFGRETTLVAPLACALVASRGHRVPMLAPLAAFAAWVITVSVWLPATPSGGSSNLVDDAIVAFDWPFAAWAKVGFASQAVLLGALLTVAALAAAQMLRDRLPEISLWLLAEAALLIVSSELVVSRGQNFARVAPFALAALALALASRVSRQAPQPIADLARSPI
jgi:hypothetical protein